jgi:hypothetical protein
LADLALAADGSNEEDDDKDSSPMKKKKATPGKAKGRKKPIAGSEEEDAIKSEVVDQDGADN